MAPVGREFGFVDPEWYSTRPLPLPVQFAGATRVDDDPSGDSCARGLDRCEAPVPGVQVEGGRFHVSIGGVELTAGGNSRLANELGLFPMGCRGQAALLVRLFGSERYSDAGKMGGCCAVQSMILLKKIYRR